MLPEPMCQCGCGSPVRLAPRTDAAKGWTKGMPLAFLKGHNLRRSDDEYVVDPTTGCWEWQWYRDRNGYGRICGRSSSALAHRLYYERLIGPIPQGLQLDHLCRNRRCVNPEHLEPVIRMARGTERALALRYGIGTSTVGAIRSGLAWSDAS